jgi:hypothetical protein
MKIIELHIPDDLASRVQQLTGNAEKFIIELLRSKVSETDRSSLASEYRLASSENEQIVKDFAHSDMEGWDEGR